MVEPRKKLLHPFLASLKNELARKLSIFVLIAGRPRSGKSYTALRIAEIIDPKFTIKQVVWTIPQLVKLLEDGNLKDGQVVVFDEAGVSANTRNWMSDANKDFSFIVQTLGYRHLCLIFTTPSVSYIDNHARKLFNWYVIPQGIDRHANVCRVKVQRMQYNPRMDQVYYHNIVHASRMCGFINLKKPSEELCKAYEAASELWKDELNKQVNKRFDSENAKNDFDLESVVSKIVENRDYFVKTHNKREIVSLQLVETFFSLGRIQAAKAKAVSEQRLKLSQRAGSV